MGAGQTFDETGATEEWIEPAGALPEALLGGRFELAGRIGEGGMGAVYRAYDSELDQAVAVKFLLGGSDARGRELERFRREAQLARLVTHPNVLRVFEFGESTRGPYLVMELVEGESLETALAREKKLAPGDVAGILRQVLEGLGAAHLAGVIHRDIKPANVLREPSGRVVLADFGIARRPGRPGVTVAGGVVGTPEYMSPEQLRGEDVDARSDLFAVGALAFTLLTGAPPRSGIVPIGSSLLRVTRDRLGRATGAPTPLRDLVDACLRLDPAERPASAAEALSILDGTRAPLRVRRRGLFTGAVLLVLAVAASVAAAPFLVAPPGLLVGPVEPAGEVPPWALAAARDVMAASLAGYAPLTKGREQRLLPVLSADGAGWMLQAGDAEGRGATIDDAAQALVRELHPRGPLDASDAQLANARAAWTGGGRETALAALDEVGPSGGFQAAVLRAMILPAGSTAAREAADELRGRTPDGPVQRALVAALAALAGSGSAEEALAAAEKVRTPATRGDAELAIVTHRLLLRAGRSEEALAVLEEQARARPKDPLAWLELGRVNLRLGRAEAAEKSLDRLLGLRAGSALGHALRGEARLSRDDAAGAAEELGRADDIGPPTAGMRLATLLSIHRKDFASAREAARRGLAQAGAEREVGFSYLALIAAHESENVAEAARLEAALSAAGE